ncbi:hypothetical protein GCM10007874_06370 [Labrys miyagiensis]|uniref:Uncharacterized protein n=1 Tax=Labrys miyagiensis TaxID=346912 RepID=A0ABQ6CH82_9HYPH|nr:hypothetical protein [Labrys miyagiensis]GLS17622.1 hypothetical protein GCM10007874_06370 [Labrys miyagiensis]
MSEDEDKPPELAKVPPHRMSPQMWAQQARRNQPPPPVPRDDHSLRFRIMVVGGLAILGGLLALAKYDSGSGNGVLREMQEQIDRLTKGGCQATAQAAGCKALPSQ